jgi:hypothetical protein
MTRYLSQYRPTTAIVAFAPDPVDFGRFESFMDTGYIHNIVSVLPNVTRPCLDAAQSVMEAIGTLGANWDGYGARPISSAVCTNAQRFLAASSLAMPNPEITPTSNGTLNFEWESHDADAYLEIGRTRYSGHVQPRHGDTVYLNGMLTDSIAQDAGVEQALALISGMIHGTSSAPALAQSVQITK